jgi:hypothetical protein
VVRIDDRTGIGVHVVLPEVKVQQASCSMRPSDIAARREKAEIMRRYW